MTFFEKSFKAIEIGKRNTAAPLHVIYSRQRLIHIYRRDKSHVLL